MKRVDQKRAERRLERIDAIFFRREQSVRTTTADAIEIVVDGERECESCRRGHVPDMGAWEEISPFEP